MAAGSGARSCQHAVHWSAQAPKPHLHGCGNGVGTLAWKCLPSAAHSVASSGRMIFVATRRSRVGPGPKHDRHATARELALDLILESEGFAEALGNGGHAGEPRRPAMMQ